MNIAIIPARGGSKRIPKKNIKKFLGKPIISYSIEAALKSKLFKKVIVSTDSEEIANIAAEYGAEVPFLRPKQLSDDFSGTHEVVGHAVEWIEEKISKLDYVCCIYATAPLIQDNDLVKGFEIIQKGNWDSVIASTSYSYPIFRSFKKNSQGGLKMIFPEFYNSRSQDLPEIYHDAGQFYWAKPEIWKKPSEMYNEKNAIVEIPNYRVQDIDTLEDWRRAELLYQILDQKNNKD
tara:strand:- start:332 stop:1033 length:702 start_codon:yes stop_codon:yes gene_type:complete